MNISIGGKSMDAMKLLNIDSYPFSEIELKQNFRSLIKIFHEDNGGNKNDARKIIEAYNHLKNLAISSDDKIEDDVEKSKIINDDLFTEECYECHGSGFHMIPKTTPIRCFCNNGKTISKCKKCNGSGRFTFKNGNNGICFACNGKGYHKRNCYVCQGSGVLISIDHLNKVIGGECHVCKGSGRIKIERFNPVIRTGEILTRKNSSR